MRSLKVHLTEEEFRGLHIAASLSPYDTQSEFLAAVILSAADRMIGEFQNSPWRLDE